MAAELQLATPTTAALNGEVLDPAALAVRAAEVAARQRSPETRRTYAAVYRSFAAFLGPSSTAAEVTPETVRAYRDALERAGRAPTTVAKHLSALRGLAEALGADAAVRTVRSARVGRGEPRSRMTSGRGCCACPTAERGRESATSRYCTYSAPPACAAPKPPPSSSPTSTSAAEPATPGYARRSRARRAGG
jgi:hypothetical protein